MNRDRVRGRCMVTGYSQKPLTDEELRAWIGRRFDHWYAGQPERIKQARDYYTASRANAVIRAELDRRVTA